MFGKKKHKERGRDVKNNPVETVGVFENINHLNEQEKEDGEPPRTKLYETSRYRCLVYREKQTDDIYLTLCGIEKCLPGYRFNAEDRTGFHLHVILAGKGILSVEGKQIALKEGQMFVTKPGEATWYRADEKEPWEYCWMAFDGNLAERYVKEAGFGPGTNWRNCQQDYRRYGALVRWILDKPEMTLANDIHRLATLLKYIATAVEDNQMSTGAERHVKTDYIDTYVEYAVNYIRANFSTAKVSDVAHYIGIHRSYLTSIFRKKLGVSPQEYLMQVKLEKAKQLLLDSQAPVQEVSQMVGYENPLTFSKSFKNRYGLSPKAFRLEHTAKNE